MKQLGDILLEGGLVTAGPARRRLRRAQGARAQALGRVLVDQGVLTESQLVAALAPADRAAVRRPRRLPGRRLGSSAACPGDVCRRHTVLPLRLRGRASSLVAMADPANVFASTTSARITGIDVTPVVATRADVLAAIDRYYRADADLDDLTAVLDDDDEDEDLSNVKEVVEDAPIVKYVNLLITQAIQDRASDIHLEPTEHDLRVRYRIDGVLHEVMQLAARAIQSGVISRLKIMADINIAERRIPQDGRLSVNANGKKIDLRVATLPTVWGEKVVMRILDNSTAAPGPRRPRLLRRATTSVYSQSFTKPYGMILVTGPTGSGKSTTLYATLNIAQPARGQHHHGRGPGRVPAARHQPGAGQRQGRPDVRRGAALDPALATPTSCSSVRSATTRPRRSPSRPPSPATSCSPRCTPTTRRRPSPDSPRWASSRSWSGPRSTACSPSGWPAGCARSARRRTTPTAEALITARFPWAGRRAAARRCPAGRLLGVLQDRLQGPAGAARGHGGHRGDRAARGRARLGRPPSPRSRASEGMAHAARGRHAQGRARA